ncbi:hypothetical protein FOXB_15629 [Fusarium oxysporum f. sp. conglutinans Fo5176]|uniref:Uncharacterized protein n=1 Tax=Fusarium oxysporum (strain Fo5176) TaxID=660025 RepID=F9GAE7_FUSOF|nr:hypothetical protein FOXB_15629 [Fusarium oxysporum f. sp. conglutinans Fo5176]
MPRATKPKESTMNILSSLATFKTRLTWAYLATQTEPHTLAGEIVLIGLDPSKIAIKL